MTSAELFVLSENALTKIVDQIKDDQWDLQVPREMTRDDKKYTVRDLINYHAYDDAWVPDTLAGKTIDEVGKKYDGDLLGDDPKKSWHEIVEKSLAAVKDADLQKNVHLTYGDYAAGEYLNHITMFRTFRTVDFARFLGFEVSLPEDLVKGSWDYVSPNAGWLRDIGVIGKEIKVPEDAPLFEKLMAITGRQPK